MIFVNQRGVIWLYANNLLTDGKVHIDIRPICYANEIKNWCAGMGLEYVSDL